MPLIKKVLAVDDNPKILYLLEKLIAKNFSDVEFIQTQSGEESIQLAMEKLPNVILLDILMPEPDGLTVCKLLKENEITRDIPVIFLSAVDNNQENRLEAIDAGADAFLAKPVNNLELLLQIRTMFKINSANLKNRNEKQKLAEELDKHSKKLQDELVRRREVEKALVESERRYRILVENQNDLVVQFNSNHQLTFTNTNYCKSFGVEDDELLGKTFFNLVHDDDLDLAKQSIDSLKEAPHKSYHEERVRTVNGWRWFGWSLKARLNHENQIVDTIAVGRDVTERKLVEDQLRKKESQLQDLNATKDKFFSIIAHDLKGPFNGIMGMSQMILELCERKEYENMVRMTRLLKKAAMQSYDLLNNLLEWSRTQSGRKSIQLQKLNLCCVITDTVNLVSLSAINKNVSIKLNCAEDLQVLADADVLNTIIRNLLSNAVKYSTEKGVVSITAIKRDLDILVSVKDDGIGMSSALQKKLFKIGENVITPGTKNEKGTGLGLILCKEFVELHGGKIWLESEVNKGTTFYFTLPLK
jgi:PAS domain S-box-containing protein